MSANESEASDLPVSRWPENEMPDDSEITRWIDALDDQKDGEEQRAAEVIWEKFFHKLVGVAQQKMSSMPKAVRDEEDIALSAMHSFFVGKEAGNFKLNSRDDLWRLLVTITIRKATAERRRQYAAKRGAGFRAVSLEADNTADPLDQIIDQHKMPELANDVRKACDELLDSLDDEALRCTAQMKMEGCSLEEISDVLSCTLEQTKYRLKKIREKWRKHYVSDD